MSRYNILVESELTRTGRLAQLEGMFDLPRVEKLTHEWGVDMDLDSKPWSIGLIVGPSGAGKSSCASQIFQKDLVSNYIWPKNESVLDGFSSELTIKQITAMLTSVGFSSPPSWRKPYHVLSTGEKFRVELARALLESESLIVFDEFTSVVDRDIAKVGSKAVAKAIRKLGKQFVAVSCHYDILEWLQPDWVLYPELQKFEWRYLRRTPEFNFVLYPVSVDTWSLFKHYHYLNGNLLQCAKCFCLMYGERPIAFSAWTRFVHPKVKNAMREHRTVVLPDWQGIGIGNTLSNTLAAYYKNMGSRVFSTTSAPGMIKHRVRSPNWRMTSQAGKASVTNKVRSKELARRFTASFEYVGT